MVNVESATALTICKHPWSSSVCRWLNWLSRLRLLFERWTSACWNEIRKVIFDFRVKLSRSIVWLNEHSDKYNGLKVAACPTADPGNGIPFGVEICAARNSTWAASRLGERRPSLSEEFRLDWLWQRPGPNPMPSGQFHTYCFFSSSLSEYTPNTLKILWCFSLSSKLK